MKFPALGLGVLLILLAPAPRGHADGVLSHEKYQLPNGLTVILHEDHKLPEVVVNIWYHVGTREEPRGRSGFAHLFEHLMFMGTKRVPDGQFDVLMESGGGWNNASTGYDRTNYYDVAPARLLPTLLWLEADRMEALGAAMNQKKLDLQREVVRNERREGYDNAPYGPAEIKISELMYPVDHPYHFDVIGSHEDLVAAEVEDVRKFFRTYYVPNNATMVIAGDFDSSTVRPLVDRLFRPIPRGAEPPRRSTPRAQFERVERVTLSDAVQLPRITMTWHSPCFYRPGDAEMDLIAFALGEGENGRLHRRLVREEDLAVSVDVWQESRRLGSIFRLDCLAKPGASLDRIEAIIDEEIERFRREGPTEKELLRARADVESRFLRNLQSLREVADTLNHYDAYLGAPDRLAFDLSRYGEAGAARVRDQARETLRLDRRLVMRVLPRERGRTVKQAREARPADLPQQAFTPPLPFVFSLENGLRVWYVHQPGLPLLTARLVLPGGSTVVPRAQAGVAQLAAEMLLEGAGELGAVAFADALDLLGARLSTAAGRESCVLSLSALERNADPALALLAKAVGEPSLAKTAFERRRSLLVDSLRQLVDRAPALAARVASEAYYGASSPYALPVAGYPETVSALTLAQLRDYHARFLGPAGALLLMAGNLPPEQAHTLARRHLGSWKQRQPRSPLEHREVDRSRSALRVFIVDRPEAEQTVIRFAYPGVGFNAKERVGLEALNSLFGGGFTSRLNANLREAHGYTYGASSVFITRERHGTFDASSSVSTAVTGASLKEFLAEFRRVREGTISDAEASKAKATLEAEAVQAFGTLNGALGAYGPYARYGRPAANLEADLRKVGELTTAQLNSLAARFIARGAGVLVLLGDRKRIESQLRGLDLPAWTVLTAAQALAGEALR